MGRLDRSVIPPLAAVLDSSDPVLVADAATALGMIGDKEAIPFLAFPAAFLEAPPQYVPQRKRPLSNLPANRS